MSTPPIILVPGYWLGAWAWDEVAGYLRREGHDVTALTLPGLDSVATDRKLITLDHHVDAICKAVEAAGRPVVLVVHSGAGTSGYAATDRVPGHIAAMIYVDTGPETRPNNPDLEGDEFPMPPLDVLARSENLDGLSPEQLQTLVDRAVPEPGRVVRESILLGNPARLDVPSIILCTGFPSAKVREAVANNAPWIGDLPHLRNVTYHDLPTSHWPMWSKPAETAEIIARIAREYGPEGAQA